MKNGKYRKRNWECGMESGKKSGEWRKGRGKWRMKKREYGMRNGEWRADYQKWKMSSGE